MPSFERADAAQQLLVAHVRPEGALVHGERLAVHVLDAVVEQHLAFEVVLALVVLQRSDLAHSRARRSCPPLAGATFPSLRRRTTRLSSHATSMTSTWSSSPFSFTAGTRTVETEGGGRELRQVRLLEPLDAVRLVALEARHRAVVLDAHHEFAARRVGERHHVLGDLVHVFAGAFAVEVVAFPCPGEVFDVVLLKATVHVPSVPDGRHFTSALLRHPSCAPVSVTSPYQASEPRSPPAFPQPHRHAVLMRRNAAACSDCSRPRKRSQHVEPLTPSDRFEPFRKPGARAAPDPRPRAGPWGSPFPGLPAGPHTALPRRTEPRDGSLPRNPLSRQGPRCFPRFFSGKEAPGRSAKQPGKPPAAGAAFAFPPCRARNPRRPSACAAGASAAIEASVDEGPRPTARREARRRASCRGEGLSSQRTRRAMWEFCRHCGAPFPPEETAVRGVCPDCAGGALRAVRELREPDPARGRAAEAEGDPRRLCPTCASELTRVCDGCGRAPSAGKRVHPRRARAGALPRLRRGLRGVRRLRGVVPRRRHGEARRRPGVLALLRAKARRRHLLLTDYKPRPPIPPGRGRGGKLPRPGDRAGDGRRRQGRRPWRASRRSGARTGSTSRATARWTAVCGAGDASHKPARPHVRGRARDVGGTCAPPPSPRGCARTTRGRAASTSHVNRDFFGKGETARALAGVQAAHRRRPLLRAARHLQPPQAGQARPVGGAHVPARVPRRVAGERQGRRPRLEGHPVPRGEHDQRAHHRVQAVQGDAQARDASRDLPVRRGAVPPRQGEHPRHAAARQLVRAGGRSPGRLPDRVGRACRVSARQGADDRRKERGAMCVIVYKPKGGRHADPRDPAEVLGAQSRRRGADVPRWRARPMAEGMHGVGVVRARAALADGGARHAGASPVALHFRIATHGGVKPGCCHPFPVCKGLRAHAGDGGRAARSGSCTTGTLSGLETGAGVSDSMAFASGRPRAAPRDVRGVRDRQARVPPHSLVDPGLALPAHGRRGRGGRVRAVGGQGRGALLQPQPPRRPRRPRRDGTRTARGASSTRSWASTPRPRTSRSSGCSPRASPAPLLEECAEYLPYCADEAQAAETADAILA